MEIELRHIHKRFGSVHASNDISATFHGGRIIGVLGENGAGKSTLMKILSGFQAADSGEIWIDGKPATYADPLSAIRHGIGMLQQDPLDVPAFTVFENFLFGLPQPRRAARRLLDELSARLGFALDADTSISTLSIAQRQQLEIVRLLALGVRALILDEPTTGISAEQKTLLFDALRRLAQDDGLLVLLVSHKLEDVIALCDEIVVLRGGQIVTADRRLPATTQEMVRLMFGQELSVQARESAALGAPVLTLDNLSVRSGRLTVEPLSLTVHAGEVVGFAGLDGSGQELIMRACVGLAKAAGGQITVSGCSLTGRHYREYLAAGVAFSAAGRLEEGLIAGLTLTEHVALVTEQAALVDWAAARAETEARLKHYNVRGRADDPIERLSGGNQQRVLMSLMPAQPRLLILEQPTRGLDVDSARWIWRQILERRQHGTAILFASPDLDELVAYADRIIVFYAGQTYEIADARQTDIDELGRLIGGRFRRGAGSTGGGEALVQTSQQVAI